MRSAERGVVAAVLFVGLACTFDSESDPAPWNGETEAGATEDGSGTDDDAEACAEPCDEAPGDCYETLGECEKGECVYSPKLAFTECVDDCELGGHCSQTGTCICTENDCASTCSAGPHTTATCTDTGECVIACEAPWDDCDGDPANGCEVPVGVPHQCSMQGLDPEGGCWAAYCGKSGHPASIDFGTFYCVDCQTCREPGDGQCQWCNHETGMFYPVDGCNCAPDAHDLACSV
jgi:hypothetical protein